MFRLDVRITYVCRHDITLGIDNHKTHSRMFARKHRRICTSVMMAKISKATVALVEYATSTHTNTYSFAICRAQRKSGEEAVISLYTSKSGECSAHEEIESKKKMHPFDYVYVLFVRAKSEKRKRNFICLHCERKKKKISWAPSDWTVVKSTYRYVRKHRL